MIEELKRGKVSLKNDATGNIHQVIGKTSLDNEKLAENAKAIIEAIRKAKPASSKGVFIKNAVLTSTMGPAVKVDANV
jgi:large subunit ribosomal protein L1